MISIPHGASGVANQCPACGGDLKLQLEAGERELWLIECRGALEHRIGYVHVRSSIEDALHEAKEVAQRG